MKCKIVLYGSYVFNVFQSLFFFLRLTFTSADNLSPRDLQSVRSQISHLFIRAQFCMHDPNDRNPSCKFAASKKNLALHWLACVWPQGYHDPSHEVIETEKILSNSPVTLWLVLFPHSKTVAGAIPCLQGLCVCLRGQSPCLSLTPITYRIAPRAISWSLVQSGALPLSWLCWDRLHQRWKGWYGSWKPVGEGLAVEACLYWLHLQTGWLKTSPSYPIPHRHTHDQPQNCNATDVNQTSKLVKLAVFACAVGWDKFLRFHLSTTSRLNTVTWHVVVL